MFSSFDDDMDVESMKELFISSTVPIDLQLDFCRSMTPRKTTIILESLKQNARIVSLSLGSLFIKVNH